MKTYTFLIGTMDDFESMDELLEHFEAGRPPAPFRNCSFYEFEAPAECDDDTVTMIGRGIAFSNNWCMDDTFSCLVDGTLESSVASKTDAQLHDLWEMNNEA